MIGRGRQIFFAKGTGTKRWEGVAKRTDSVLSTNQLRTRNLIPMDHKQTLIKIKLKEKVSTTLAPAPLYTDNKR